MSEIWVSMPPEGSARRAAALSVRCTGTDARAPPCVGENADVTSGRADSVPNILAARYASPEMVEIFSAEHKVRLERRLWIAVMRAQQSLGVDVPDEAIEAYEQVVDRVDLDSIDARERVTRHDVKARLE